MHRGRIVGDLAVRPAEALGLTDRDAVVLAQHPRQGAVVVAGRRVVVGVGRVERQTGIQGQGRGDVQQMQFRALLPGDQRRPPHGAIGRGGKIGGGNDGLDGLHEILLAVSR